MIICQARGNMGGARAAEFFGLIQRGCHKTRKRRQLRGRNCGITKELEEHLDTRVCSARPYSACERAANENTNGSVRRFLPKHLDLRTVTQAELDIVVQRLNNRPRKRLDYPTPCEVFKKAIVALCV